MNGSRLVLSAALLAAVCAWCSAGELPPPPPAQMPPAAPPPGNAPAPGDPGAAGEQPEKKELTARVFLDSDVLYLRDGTELKGTIILIAQKAAVVLTEKGEEMVPRENIEKIVLGKDKEKATTLPVRSRDGFLFLVMEPIEDQPLEGGADGAAPAAAPEPAKKAPAAAARPKPALEPPKLPARRHSPVAPPPGYKKSDDSLKKVSPNDKEIQKLMGNDAKLKDLIDKANQDPELKKTIEQMQKRLGTKQ